MYCACGCEKITNIANRTDSGHGWIKGKHKKFVKNHSLRVNWGEKRRKDIDAWLIDNQSKHVCSCGCGRYINVMRHHFWNGITKYIHGHHSKTAEFRVERIRYNTTHTGKMSNRWVYDRSKVRTWRKAFLASHKREIYTRDEGKCRSCGTFTLLTVHKIDPLKANFDHIVAIKNGGKTDVSNGQVLCLLCHKLKHSAIAKVANSVKPKLEQSSMAIPNQASAEMPRACVESMDDPRKG